MKTPNKATGRRKAFAAHYIASRYPVSDELVDGYSDGAAATQGARMLEDADAEALIAEVEARKNAEDDVTRTLQAMLRF